MIAAGTRFRHGRGLRLAAVAFMHLVAPGCTGDGVIAPVPDQVDLAMLAPAPAGFQRGMNLEPIGGPGGTPDLRPLGASLDTLAQLGIDHVAVVPGVIQEHLGDRLLRWQGSRQRVQDDTRAVIRMAHARGLRVLLKPHVWLRDRSGGAWRGNIDPDAAAWPEWSAAYRDVVLGFARLATEEGVAQLALGTELSALAIGRPDFWRQLAAASREVFPGQLTYAANWYEEFQRIEFWPALDVIGVDAFWPLAEAADEVVTLASCRPRMHAVAGALRAVALRHDRPLLLTEIGYKSAAGGLFAPWTWHEGGAVDLDSQAIAYACLAEVLGEAAAREGWLQGAYVWNWHVSRRWSGSGNSDFTPRGKPAQLVLQAWFRPPRPPG